MRWMKDKHVINSYSLSFDPWILGGSIGIESVRAQNILQKVIPTTSNIDVTRTQLDGNSKFHLTLSLVAGAPKLCDLLVYCLKTSSFESCRIIWAWIQNGDLSRNWILVGHCKTKSGDKIVLDFELPCLDSSKQNPSVSQSWGKTWKPQDLIDDVQQIFF